MGPERKLLEYTWEKVMRPKTGPKRKDQPLNEAVLDVLNMRWQSLAEVQSLGER